MRVSFVDNVNVKLLTVLADELAQAQELKFAVAFVTSSGLSLIRPHIETCLERGGRLEVLLGLDLLTTEPKALRTLLEMAQRGLNVSLFWYSGPFKKSSSIYHPKVYLAAGKTETTIAIGSSNLTEGGLRGNIEINVVIRAEPTEEVVSDIYGIYNALKFQQPRVQPDAELVGLYEAVHERVQARSRTALSDPETKGLMTQLREKILSLRRPSPTVADLFGWQKIVFQRLPTDTFRNSDIYAFENEFQRYYPQNQNIKAKIRQILQQLRDLGLIRHLGTNTWEKVSL